MQTTEQTDNNGKWYSVNDALKKLDVSRNTLYAKLNTDAITSKKQGKFRLVWIDEHTPDVFANMTNAYTNTTGNNRERELEEQVSYFKGQVETLQLELSKTRERTDTIILKMTEEKNLLLQEARKPFWRFW